jgi:hypothetical protein
MKALLLAKPALIIAGFAFLLGCQKETLLSEASSAESMLVGKNTSKINEQEAVERPFKGEVTSDWIQVFGESGFNVYGTGGGNFTHLGKSHFYYNTYTPYDNRLTFVHAPVNAVPDLNTALTSYGYNLPENVSAIFFDEHGNSIWSHQLAVGIYTPTATSHVLIDGEFEIVGGTGRFAGAEGHYTVSGYFNQDDYQDVGLKIFDGVIKY